MRLTALLTAALGACALSHAEGPAPPPFPKIAIVDINVLPMTADIVLETQTILIEDGRIRTIGPRDDTPVPDGFTEIDGMGRFALPGLGDMHTHFRQADADMFANYLAAGITLVRDMDGRPRQLAWRDEVNLGTRLGPRMFVASPTMANRRSPFEGYPTPETPEAARETIARFAEEGYDFVKVYSYLPRAIYFAVIEEARRLGLPVAGHIPLAVGLDDALTSGLASNEHLTGYFDAIATPEGARLDSTDYRGIFFGAALDEHRLRALADQTREAGMWNVPTLMWFTKRNANRRARDAWADDDLRWQGHQNRIAVVRALHEAGARLMLGTDSDGGEDLPATAIYEELQLMTDAGLSAYEALHTSTTAPAEYLGLADSGTLKPGNRADLVIASCNPAREIRCIQYIDEVFIHGRPAGN